MPDERTAEALRDDLARTRLLEAVAEAAAAPTTLAELAERALAALVEHLDLRSGVIGAVDEEGQELHFLAAVGIDSDFMESVRRMALDPESPALPVLAAVRNEIVRDADAPKNPARREMLERAGYAEPEAVVRNIGVPIEADGQVLGSIGLAFRSSGEFTPEETDIFRSVAHVLGQAFKNARLFESQQRLLALMDHNPSLLFLKDAHGRYVYLNKAYEDEFVHSKDWYGKTDFDFWPRESAELFRADDTAVLEANETIQFVEDSRDSQGDRHVWLTYKFPFTDAEGRRYSGGIGIDATEMVEAQEALAASEAKVQDLLRYAPTGIYEVGFDPPRFISTNDAMSVLSGYSPDELSAMNPFDLLDDPSKQLFRERIAAALAGATIPTEVEYGVVRKDGSRIQVVLNLRLLRDENGTPYGAFVIGHDVTERRQTEDALRRSETRYRTLYRVSDALAKPMELQNTLDALAESTLQAIEHTRVRIGLVEREGLRVATSRGAPPLHDPVIMPWEIAAPSVKEVIRKGRPDVIDYDAVPPEERGYAEKFDSHILLWVPIRRGREVVGLIGIDDPGERRDFDQDEIELVQAMAAQAAVAIENARLFESERRSAALNRALSQISAELSRTIDLEATIPSALSLVAEAIGAAGVSIAMREEGRWTVTHGWGIQSDLEGTVWAAHAAPGQEQAFGSRQPVIVEDVQGSEVGNEKVIKQTGLRAFGIYPLLVRGQPIGSITITFKEPQEFGERVASFMSRVAYVLSSALESARLYEVEHNIAETLQETLVVLPSRLPGIEFARAYESATYQTGWVGGDFVDLFETGPHEVGVVIGDVSGKGIEAAATTSLVRNTVRAHAVEGLSPGEVCDKTNRVVFRFSEVEEYVTLFFGVLDTRNRQLRYVSAGHPPALIVSAADTQELLVTGAPMIGAFDEVRYEEHRIALRPGDRLLLYTDGVTEARSADGERWFGSEGLWHAIDRHRDEPTSRLPQALMHDIVEFSQGTLRDDLAILAVEPIGVPAG